MVKLYIEKLEFIMTSALEERITIILSSDSNKKCTAMYTKPFFDLLQKYMEENDVPPIPR